MTETELVVDQDIEELLDSVLDNGSKLILYNDDHHNVLEVTLQLMKAVGCNSKKAAKIMFEAHTKGKAIALVGSKQRCEDAAKVLREIALQCEVEENE